MGQDHEYRLSVAEVATHCALSERTIRGHLDSGALAGVRIGGEWRCAWHDLWAVQQGPRPRGTWKDAYKRPLQRKKHVADKWNVSVRTVERWIERGLPTRNVFGNVRIAPVDEEEWTRQEFRRGKAA